MRAKFLVTLVAGVVVAASGAEAKTTWHLYGAVRVNGDRALELAYANALASCRLEGYRWMEGRRIFAIDYDAPDTVSCLSRKGFIRQDGEPHAYPFAKETYSVRVDGG